MFRRHALSLLAAPAALMAAALVPAMSNAQTALDDITARKQINIAIPTDFPPGEVLRVVEGLADEGMTLLMVTHEMGFARKVADRVVFMHAGRIHEAGPPEALFRAPKTPELQQFLAALH